MAKKIFLSLFAFLVVSITAFTFYKRNQANVHTDAASIGIGIGALTPTPIPAGQMAMQDAQSTIGSTSFDMKPTVSPGPVKTLAGGMKMQDLIVGTGETAKRGMTVSVLYTGTLENGTKFDSSLDKKKPFQFVLGAGSVIKGFDTGITGMRVGGKRKLGIPPSLAYGMQGAGNVIPPNAPLYFDVELLDAQPAAKSR